MGDDGRWAFVAGGCNENVNERGELLLLTMCVLYEHGAVPLFEENHAPVRLALQRDMIAFVHCGAMPMIYPEPIITPLQLLTRNFRHAPKPLQNAPFP